MVKKEAKKDPYDKIRRDVAPPNRIHKPKTYYERDSRKKAIDKDLEDFEEFLPDGIEIKQ